MSSIKPLSGSSLRTSTDGAFAVVQRQQQNAAIGHVRTHSQQNGSNLSPFLRLPAELRELIYRFALIAEYTVEIGPGTWPDNWEWWPDREIQYFDGEPAASGLFVACKQIRQEILPIYYGENTFDAYAEVGRMSEWLRQLKPEKGSLLSCLQVSNVNNSDLDKFQELYNVIQQVQRLSSSHHVAIWANFICYSEEIGDMLPECSRFSVKIHKRLIHSQERVSDTHEPQTQRTYRVLLSASKERGVCPESRKRVKEGGLAHLRKKLEKDDRFTIVQSI